ncbi:erythromycin esterase family protein [Nocardiopsis sp. FR4]|uniref:erythromycin esterase family protein n=1 Tax=Nocardiopsis sp. FR4 TaxID=2605985 RepID=UPI001357A1BA|nr:erythromycin esterase family protein [Nocardiopsis sp. FR4]
MTQDIQDILRPSCDLLALGEPAHREPAFGWVRNALFVRLVDRGFRSIALETDRVAALSVNDFVQGGAGTLDAVMREGFSHGFGGLDANRQLVAWMRERNQDLPPGERLALHGFDTPTENTSAPSPRPYLEHVRAYLGLDLDLSGPAGADDRWSSEEAVLDPAMSPGATAGAERLRVIADDMLTALYTRAPELVAATSRADWLRARTHLTAGRGLLRYHRQAAVPLERSARMTGLLASRDALMAQNLLDLRGEEARRGATLVCAHNLHLRRGTSTMRVADMDTAWAGAGEIVTSLSQEEYAFVAGSLGRSEALGLGEPDPDTHEGLLGRRVTAWGLVAATEAGPARTRTDTNPQQGYFPLDQDTLDAADAVLHIGSGTAAVAALS